MTREEKIQYLKDIARGEKKIVKKVPLRMEVNGAEARYFVNDAEVTPEQFDVQRRAQDSMAWDDYFDVFFDGISVKDDEAVGLDIDIDSTERLREEMLVNSHLAPRYQKRLDAVAEFNRLSAISTEPRHAIIVQTLANMKAKLTSNE